MPKKKENLRQKFKALEVEKQHTKRVANTATVDAAYDGNAHYEGEDKELVGEWESLRRHAKVHFPEGADFVNVTPPQKLVAIAQVLGWSIRKISKASGIPERTVHRWLSPKENPEVVYFGEQFAVKQGKRSVEDMQNDNIYRFMRFIEDVMLDKTDDLPTRRLKFDVGKYNWEMVKGKPGQTIEHKGIDLKTIYAQLGALSPQELEEEEEALFDDEKVH